MIYIPQVPGDSDRQVAAMIQDRLQQSVLPTVSVQTLAQLQKYRYFPGLQALLPVENVPGGE